MIFCRTNGCDCDEIINEINSNMSIQRTKLLYNFAADLYFRFSNDE